MQKRPALGRGLSALLTTAPPVGAIAVASAAMAPEPRREYQVVGIEQVRPAHAQPRKRFEETALQALKTSIAAAGVLQPLVVRRLEGEAVPYEIVAGERRWRAARLAGLTEVPVVIKDVAGGEALTLAYEENVQREDLNPIEEAETLRRLLEDHGRTQEQLAERLGRDRSSIANALRLLKLANEVQEFVISGDLSAGHAKALLMLEGGAAAQLATAQRIIDEGLSVRATEALCRPEKSAARSKKSDAADSGASPKSPASSLGQRAVEEQLQRRLGTKVRLLPKGQGGSIHIDYYSLAELERLVDQLSGR